MAHIRGIDNQGNYNTESSDYTLDILDLVHAQIDQHEFTPSKRVVSALQRVDGRIQTKGFRKSVLEAIFEDAVAQDYESDPQQLSRLRSRLERRFGKVRAKQLLLAKVEILDSWRKRDAAMVPDAFLVDSENRTVVFYEVEDTHPLNPDSICAYAFAWHTLDYIFWDLHLIAYDAYGHARVIVFPHAALLAHQFRKRGRRRRDLKNYRD